ncbi:hypothetical protein [Streptomyces olivaceoviridis]|uniref:hypothetical protein n=1 Tax=Streptomyces olivaceoviridis TaxID=1921 RepID=UPI0033326190
MYGSPGVAGLVLPGRPISAASGTMPEQVVQQDVHRSMPQPMSGASAGSASARASVNAVPPSTARRAR